MKKKALIIVISVLAVVLLFALAAHFIIDRFLSSLEYKIYPLPEEYLTEIENQSEEYGVPIELVCGVIHTESSFDPNAVSSAGAKGMMQITKDTFDWLLFKTKEEHEESALFDYKINIKYGTLFLSILYEEFGDWDTVFAAYNAGRGRVNGWLMDERYSEDGKLKNIPFRETAEYIEKVNKASQYYLKLYFNEQTSE